MAFDQKAYHKQWCKDHPERVKAYKDRSLKKHPQKKRRSENVPAYRLYAYRAWDKKHGFTDTLSKEEAVEAMMMECTYCGLLPANGLDRVDSSQGHHTNNVIGCCEKCNFILGDLPREAKAELIEGLSRIREQGLLSNWIIPTKRNK